MMMRAQLSAFSLLCSVAFMGCDSKSTASQEITPSKSSLTRVTNPQVSEADQTTLAADNAAFAFDAYHKIAAQHANLVFSPASVSIALSMAYAGAAGATASEMAAALRFSLPAERLFPAFNSLDLNLASRGQDKKSTDGGPMQVRIVNAAWAERTHQFRSEYLDILASNFGQTSGAVWETGDFTYDNAVGIGDFSLLAANFNTTGRNPAAVPEPSSTRSRTTGSRRCDHF